MLIILLTLLNFALAQPEKVYLVYTELTTVMAVEV
jgi:hypothetical protein